MKLLKYFPVIWLVVAGSGHPLWAAEPSVNNELILPLVANGIVQHPKHFQATFSFLNLSDSTVQGTLEVFDDQGTLQTNFLFCEPIVGPPEALEFTLQPNGLFHHTGITDGELIDGWGRVTWEGSARVEGSVEVTLLADDPIPCLVICNRSSTDVLTAVQAKGVEPARAFRAPAILTPNRHTAFAIVNPSETQTATVDLAVFDKSGQSVDANSFQIPPRSRLTHFLWDLMILGKVFVVPPVPPEEFHGSVRITSDTPFAVGGVHVLFPEGEYVNLFVDTVEK